VEELYYAHPVQVRYWNSESHNYYGAICYHDFLIDAISGEVCFIMNVIRTAANDGVSADDAIIELDWLNLNKAILAL
jgi:hypothetical protein